MASAAQFPGHADLRGVRLWYTDSGGDGVPVLLLHANTGNADGWQYNIPGFVEAGYRAIAFDRRGVHRATRGLSLDQQGTARSLQPQRATVHPQVLGFFQRNDESVAK